MSQKNMGRLAQDMKREVIAIIGRLKDPRLEGGLLTVTRAHRGQQKNAHPQGTPLHLCGG